MDRKRESAEADSAAQLERFKEAARALGCDEDEAAFDEKLKSIARQQQMDEPKAAKGSRTGRASRAQRTRSADSGQRIGVNAA